MIDLLALMGDSSDNVPGVPRVGQKTAQQLLEKFGTLDATLARADEVKQPSIQKALREHKDSALLSRELVTIRTEISLSSDIADLSPVVPDVAALRVLFEELEFSLLLKGLPKEPSEQLAQHYVIIRDPESLERLLDDLRRAVSFAIDIETTNLDPMRARLVGVSFAKEAGTAYYVPFNAQPPVLEGGREALIAAIKPLLEDPALEKTGQNIKYILHVLRNEGIEVAGTDFDTMIASYCLRPGTGTHSLDALALEYFDYVKIPTKQLIGTGKKQMGARSTIRSTWRRTRS